MRATVVSKALAPDVNEVLGCPPERIRYIPNGIDVKRFRYYLRTTTTKPIIYSIGTLGGVKRPDLAIRALRVLADEIPCALLRIVGDGPQRRDLQRLAAELRLTSNVEFLGQCLDIPGLLEQGHLLWHFSDSEGLPLVCVEAMASGLPVVASNVGGIGEIVIDGQTGFLIPHGDAATAARKTLELLTSGGYEQFAEASRTRAAEHFGLDRMVEAHIDAMLDAHGGRW